ncbi:hypothetical protein DMN91_006537 [Ooceraea biroi]|uniref:Mos1 transposase HTH domain-containing protein n=1 Tax=Ooceraea biroi TaxID=2015173 RepID=A0A3L8DP30_OOCBI|nr:hypothetical protein DMN91_006537 [Ooceraea biroi]
MGLLLVCRQYGIGYRNMSRNHKDKYENSNPRRIYTLMGSEDLQSGKKSHWSELEITGSIRNLSPNLWQMIHLTALYLNDNSLQRVPAEIGRLVNLRILDLSSNKLRSLPAELGDLIYLRELLLNQNYLRVLPYELGKLFQLQVLGLQGNPLSKEVMALYGNGEPAGTNKLLSFMLDHLQVSETARNINAVFGEGSTTKATVGNWFKNFRDGDFSLANEPRGRPKTKVDNDHLRAVVESDPSQNLSPTDYHFFRNLDNLLVGKFFNSQQAVETAFRDFIDSRTPGFYSRGIDQLPLKWQKQAPVIRVLCKKLALQSKCVRDGFWNIATALSIFDADIILRRVGYSIMEWLKIARGDTKSHRHIPSAIKRVYREAAGRLLRVVFRAALRKRAGSGNSVTNTPTTPLELPITIFHRYGADEAKGNTFS